MNYVTQLLFNQPSFWS